MAHYDPELSLKLSCDASAYGLDTVLSHIYPEGTERPKAYALRTLTRAQKNYTQIDKEALSLVFGMDKFEQHAYGRHFILATDHKPLVSIFGPKKGLPAMAASRLQRYVAHLRGFDFEIQYVKGSKHGNFDGLSRLPLSGNTFETEDIEKVFTYLNYAISGSLPINSADIKSATTKDPILSKVLKLVMFGWPQNRPEDKQIQPFRLRTEDITVESRCLMWGVSRNSTGKFETANFKRAA